MKILITGAKGFIGKNLAATLNNIREGKDASFGLEADIDVFEYDADTDPKILDAYCRDCGFVFHLAGANRPKLDSEFMEGNFGFTSILLRTLKKYNNKSPVMISSSIQAQLDNPYGRSKKSGEELVLAYSAETGARALVYRFPNVFGKWCRPNYNSAVATFCYNIANGLPITVSNRNAEVTLCYIDDVVSELISALNGGENKEGVYCRVPVEYKVTLGAVADLLYSFKAGRDNKSVPDMSDGFTKKLYATYLSYLPADRFNYPLKMNKDYRGSFTEMLRTPDRGQFSVSVLKPGATKGNHWHHTKVEKFVVVSGKGVLRFRRPDYKDTIEYFVSGDKIEIIDIPPGYAHSIENLGKTDLVTFIWASEPFDPDKSDTYQIEV